MSAAVRVLTSDEWRRVRLARMAAVEAMPYFARAVFAMVPVAMPGLGTFAVDRHWRLYIDPAMLGSADGWTIPQASAVLLHEVGHLLREHAARGDAVDMPVDRAMWNIAGDAEINDDLLSAGLGLPSGAVTPAGIGCQDGHAAEVYYRHLVPPQAVRAFPGADEAGVGCGSGPVIPRFRVSCLRRPTWAVGPDCQRRQPIWCAHRWRRRCRRRRTRAVRGEGQCPQVCSGGRRRSLPLRLCRGRRFCVRRYDALSRIRRGRCITRGAGRIGVRWED